MQHLKEKFKLDRIAETRLSDILARCSDEKKDEYYHDLERPSKMFYAPDKIILFFSSVLSKIMSAAILLHAVFDYSVSLMFFFL